MRAVMRGTWGWLELAGRGSGCAGGKRFWIVVVWNVRMVIMLDVGWLGEAG